MIRAGLRLLGDLHARGFHAAVLAAMVVMPTVTAFGYLTRDAEHAAAASKPGEADLRASFDDNR